jgi:hypothetical protein
MNRRVAETIRETIEKTLPVGDAAEIIDEITGGSPDVLLDVIMEIAKTTEEQGLTFHGIVDLFDWDACSVDIDRISMLDDEVNAAIAKSISVKSIVFKGSLVDTGLK